MGPESDKPSFSWVSKDIFDTLKDEYNVIYFRAFKEIPKSFDGLVKGEYDHMPEAAFYMVGGMDEAIEKAKKLEAEAA